jgi:hypothetical protein
MHDVTAPIICASCELEIQGSPTINAGLPFCCAGCAAGGPCTCTYDPEVGDEPFDRQVGR